MPERCVGYSAISDDDQCTTKVKFKVRSAKFGADGHFFTCGRHLSWAINRWLLKRGNTVHEVELVEDAT